MREDKIKHLELIQNNITRMNQNSFLLKGWMITIVAALLALFVENGNKTYIWIAIGPTVVFWFLDAYYLQQERKFRGVYNDVAEISPEDERKAIKDFEMPIRKYKCGEYCYFNVMWSFTIAAIYVPVIIGLILAGLIIK